MWYRHVFVFLFSLLFVILSRDWFSLILSLCIIINTIKVIEKRSVKLCNIDTRQQTTKYSKTFSSWPFSVLLDFWLCAFRIESVQCKNIGRVVNCHDITILSSLCCLFVCFSFRLFVQTSLGSNVWRVSSYKSHSIVSKF